jgi:hypothetical protein
MARLMLFPTLSVLYFYVSTYQSMCAVSNMAVFCSSLISCFPGMLLRYFVNDFEMDPVAPVIGRPSHLCFYILNTQYFRGKVFIF